MKTFHTNERAVTESHRGNLSFWDMSPVEKPLIEDTEAGVSVYESRSDEQKDFRVERVLFQHCCWPAVAGPLQSQNQLFIHLAHRQSIEKGLSGCNLKE